MDFFLGICFAFLCLVLLTMYRFYQYYTKYQSLVKDNDSRNRSEHVKIIVMLDHYRGAELDARLEATIALYKQLANNNTRVVVLLATGKLMGDEITIALRNMDTLHAMGIPLSSLDASSGFSGNAADTFQEVRSACEHAKEVFKVTTVHIVANPLQAFQAFGIAIFNGIYPQLCVIPLLEESPAYAVGKFFQGMLTFFDPNGWNPLSCFIRYKRKNISNTF
ncbi:MAG: hypothetical protein G01um101470_256 [Parcubacteria group bacterium Gr01-1014_70]|nr:MAG: hypothetical protein G01um101470_256 [Parcubacteria group bacterium Gr01-1014_70]